MQNTNIINFTTGKAIAPHTARPCISTTLPNTEMRDVIPTPQKKPSFKDMQKESIRKSMIAKVKIAQKQLGMDDGTYRAMLWELYNVESCTKCTHGQLHDLLLHMEKCGWNKKRRGGGTQPKPTNPNAPMLQKIEALLAEKGNEEGTVVPWSYAESILTRQTHGTARTFDKATPMQIRGVIAAMVKDAMRKGRYCG